MIDKLLKRTLAPQLQALLEKLESAEPGDTSSYHEVKNFLITFDTRLTRHERYIFKRALRKFGRVHVLDRAMEIVLNLDKPEEKVKAEGTFRFADKRHLYAGIQGTFEQEYAKRQFAEAPVKREGEHVNY